MGYLEAYRARMIRNQEELFQLAKDVLAKKPEIEIYHYKGDRYVDGLVFFDSENINSVHFHEVPYRWSGCKYKEFGSSHWGGDNCAMPFSADDVLTTFRPVTQVRKSQVEMFKSKEDYLKWCNYLKRFEHETII